MHRSQSRGPQKNRRKLVQHERCAASNKHTAIHEAWCGGRQGAPAAAKTNPKKSIDTASGRGRCCADRDYSNVRMAYRSASHSLNRRAALAPSLVGELLPSRLLTQEVVPRRRPMVSSWRAWDALAHALGAPKSCHSPPPAGNIYETRGRDQDGRLLPWVTKQPLRAAPGIASCRPHDTMQLPTRLLMVCVFSPGRGCHRGSGCLPANSDPPEGSRWSTGEPAEQADRGAAGRNPLPEKNARGQSNLPMPVLETPESQSSSSIPLLFPRAIPRVAACCPSPACGARRRWLMGAGGARASLHRCTVGRRAGCQPTWLPESHGTPGMKSHEVASETAPQTNPSFIARGQGRCDRP